jgi:hypothetical protein
MTKTNSIVTYNGYKFELGERDIHRIILYLEASPPIESVKKFIFE